MKFNLLIVEDEEILNDYICSAFKTEDINIKRAYSAEEAIEVIENNKIHLIITDIIMENKSGFDLLEYISNANYKIPAIVLTALGDDESLRKAYDLGAIDYLKKPVDINLLKSKVNNFKKILHSGTEDGFELIKENHLMKINGEEVYLTKTEYEILELLYLNSPRIYTKDNLIDNIWASNYSMSLKIIEVNIFNIRKKMGTLSMFLKTKRGVGYYFENKK